MGEATMNDKPKVPTQPITDLLEEIQHFDWTMFPPMDEIDSEHDHILGSCPEELRRFYSFSRFCERELKSLQLDAQFSSEKDPTLEPRMLRWSKKYQTTRQLLWFALWEYFDAHQPHSMIALTKDWSVVVTEQQDGPPLPPFIAGLFRQG